MGKYFSGKEKDLMAPAYGHSLEVTWNLAKVWKIALGVNLPKKPD
jgi:hypothetical protein